MDRGIAMFPPPTGAFYGFAEYKKKEGWGGGVAVNPWMVSKQPRSCSTNLHHASCLSTQGEDFVKGEVGNNTYPLTHGRGRGVLKKGLFLRDLDFGHFWVLTPHNVLIPKMLFSCFWFFFPCL